jgi:hypothetical protein
MANTVSAAAPVTTPIEGSQRAFSAWSTVTW